MPDIFGICGKWKNTRFYFQNSYIYAAKIKNSVYENVLRIHKRNFFQLRFLFCNIGDGHYIFVAFKIVVPEFYVF